MLPCAEQKMHVLMQTIMLTWTHYIAGFNQVCTLSPASKVGSVVVMATNRAISIGSHLPQLFPLVQMGALPSPTHGISGASCAGNTQEG